MRGNSNINHSLLDTPGLTMPVKLSLVQVVGVLARKLVEDPDFRATSINLLKFIARKRAMQQLVQRIKRKAY